MSDMLHWKRFLYRTSAIEIHNTGDAAFIDESSRLVSNFFPVFFDSMLDAWAPGPSTSKRGSCVNRPASILAGPNREVYPTRTRQPTSMEKIFSLSNQILRPPLQVSYLIKGEMGTPVLFWLANSYCVVLHPFLDSMLCTQYTSISRLSRACNAMQCSQRFQTKWNRCRGAGDMNTWPVVTKGCHMRIYIHNSIDVWRQNSSIPKVGHLVEFTRIRISYLSH